MKRWWFGRAVAWGFMAGLTGPNMSAQAQAPGRAATWEYMVGRWTDRNDCSSATAFAQDGGFEGPLAGKGSWFLNGGRLTLNYPDGRKIEMYVVVADADTVNVFGLDGSKRSPSKRCKGSAPSPAGSPSTAPAGAAPRSSTSAALDPRWHIVGYDRFANLQAAKCQFDGLPMLTVVDQLGMEFRYRNGKEAAFRVPQAAPFEELFVSYLNRGGRLAPDNALLTVVLPGKGYDGISGLTASFDGQPFVFPVGPSLTNYVDDGKRRLTVVVDAESLVGFVGQFGRARSLEVQFVDKRKRTVHVARFDLSANTKAAEALAQSQLRCPRRG